MLPIVQRELRVVSRNKSLYRGRYRIALAGAIFAMFIVLLGQPGGGGRIFFALTFIACVFALLEGVRKTSDCISEEKREGTLGLLFLTDLKGHDVILGKLAANSLRSFQGLLAFLPVLAITLLLGGVTLAEFGRSAAVLLNTLFVSLAVGIAVSTLSRERGTLATTLVLLAWALLGIFGSGSGWIGFNTLSDFLKSFGPVTALVAGSEVGYRNPTMFWAGLAAAHVTGWLFLIVAGFVLPRVWQDKEVKPTPQAQTRTLGRPIVRAKKRADMLDQNPIMWLAFNERSSLNYQTVFLLLISLLILALFLSGTRQWEPAVDILAWLANMFLWLGIATEASRPLADARRSGALELMLSTPLRVNQIIDGLWLAIRKTFLWPGLALLTIYITVLLIALVAGNTSYAFFAGKAAVYLAAGSFAAGWMGMLMGLTQKSRNRALFKTILWTTVLPSIPFCPAEILFWLPIMAVSKNKLTAQMRRIAADRYYSPFTIGHRLPGNWNLKL